ncbi:kinase-like protein, partial [Auricularia subglabra TFB-10046 SS5]
EPALLHTLSHANVIRIFESQTAGGHTWMVLELLGPDLQAVIQTGGGFDESRAQGLARDLASGLEYLHARGIIHRDVKPPNVLFTDALATRAKIADFGISATADNDGRTIKAQGYMMGTEPFMAPEIKRGGRYTNRVDVWSLG